MHPCLVIAELGVNHEGDADVCATMIEQAAAAGADAVKLITVDPDSNYERGSISHDVFSSALLTREQTARMFELANSLGMEAFTTVGDLVTLAWVMQLNVPAYKVSSGLLTTTPLVERVARTGKPVILSTGMATLDDIDTAVAAAQENGTGGIGVLQCTSLYPAAEDTLNLAVIAQLERRYGVPAGFSDHSVSADVPPFAVAAGARLVEKHFSLDTTRTGYDHPVSLMPGEFAGMVAAIRRVERLVGNPHKQPHEQERDRSQTTHRHLAAARDLDAGHLLREEDIVFLRLTHAVPGALVPGRFSELVGKRLNMALVQHQAVESKHVQG
jgi:sialic acid synthase SpsE